MRYNLFRKTLYYKYIDAKPLYDDPYQNVFNK